MSPARVCDRPRRRIAGTPEHQVELRVVGAGDPGRAAAHLPGIVVLRPGLVALLAAGRDGVLAPELLAGRGVVAIDEAAHAELGAGIADHQHAVRNQRRERQRNAILPVSDLRLPQFLAVLGVVRDHVSVECGAEDLAVVDRGALVRHAAADHARGLRRPIQRLLPDLLAGGDVDRDRGPGIGDVHHAVVDDRLRLLAPVIVEAEIPDRHQPLDGLLVDLLERTVALLMVAHSVGENVVSRAAVAVLLEIVERLRGDAGAEQKQNGRGRCDGLHERRSLISRIRSSRFNPACCADNKASAPAVESLDDAMV